MRCLVIFQGGPTVENGLDPARAVNYAQESVKKGFFRIVTTVLYLCVLWVEIRGLFGTEGTIPRLVIVPQTLEWQDRSIMLGIVHAGKDEGSRPGAPG